MNAQKTLGQQGGLMGKYAQQVFGDFSKESQRQMQEMYQIQRREAVNQQITLKGKEAELAKMAKIDGDMTKQQKERVELLKKEIDLLKEKQRTTLQTAAEAQKALGNMGGGAGGGGAGGGPGSPSPVPPSPNTPPSAMQEFFTKYLSKLTLAAGAAAMANGALNMTSDMITRDRKIGTYNAGSYGIIGQDMKDNMSGGGSRSMFYLNQRAKAMRNATTEGQRQRYADFLPNSAGSAVMGLGAAAAGGYAGLTAGGVAGAYAGSLLGPVGSVVGAGIGAIGGGLIGAGLGLYGSMSERGRARYFDQKKYNALKTKEDLENYQQNLTNEIAKDPRRSFARDYFEGNRENIMGVQKLAGINTDAGLLAGDASGLFNRNMRYGNQYGGVNFSEATITQQMQALASGGAMTSGIQDLSGAAATYNRQFNLSNAGQTLGRMQGNTGMNSSLTDMAYQKILSEAVRMGVDTSTMPRELEKFAQTAAELTTAGGVNATGMNQLFNGAIGGFNEKAIGAAASVAQEYVNTSKETGGWQGQMGYGYLQSSEAKKLMGRNLTAKEMNMLNQTSANELDEAGLNQIAGTLGVSSDTARQLLSGKDKYKQTLTNTQDQAVQNLSDYFKKVGATTPEAQQKAISEGPGAALFGKLKEENMAVMGQRFSGKSQAEQTAYNLEQANVLGGISPSTSLEDAAKKVEEQKRKAETRSGYVEEGSQATGDMARQKALLDYSEEFKKAARANTEAAELYNSQFAKLLQATENGTKGMEGLAKALEEFEHKVNGGYSTNTPSTQPKGK